jgi:hypothetical protein
MPIARILRCLVLLALLLAPVSMASTHAAMAMPASPAVATSGHEAAPAAGHCADTAPVSQDAPADDAAPAKNIDCTIACSCMPPAVGSVAERASFTAGLHRPEVAPLLTGLSLEAEPRPPKRA